MNISVEGYDPRVVANAILDLAENEFGCKLSNLRLQKLLYFTHCNYLFEYSRPLIYGYFEAWQYGPVSAPVYSAFKLAGAGDIEFRAKKFDVFSGEMLSLDSLSDKQAIAVIRKVLDWSKHLSNAQLVDISHAKGGPWDKVVQRAKNSVALGMRITDQLIKEAYKNQKIILGGQRNKLGIGDILEDAPFTPDRFS
ncbi:MAG: type VI toxin-antitoxin system SocA family antitoxin [Asticcacaulis sp.]|uniref:type VI toxin-antitoxin system SocA family antitoxin n=1 Tax=Asticcacaulis sp. TaxID=1872648 RepID=UPI003F7C5819